MEFINVFHTLPLTNETAQVDMSFPEVPKRMHRDQKIEWFQAVLVQRQLDLFGLTWAQVKELEKGDPDWFKNGYMLTERQYGDLKTFGVKLMRKLFKWSIKTCNTEWAWWSLNNILSVKFVRG